MLRPLMYMVIFALFMGNSYAQLMDQSRFPAFKVGDREFSKGRVDSAATFLAMQQTRGQQVPPEMLTRVRYAVVQELVVSELLKLEAKALKVKPTKGLIDTMSLAARSQFGGDEASFKKFLAKNGVTEKEFKEKTTEQAMVEMLVRQIAPNNGAPTEKEMLKFFEENRKLFPVDDSIAGVRILLKTDGKADDVATKTQFLEGLGAQVKLKKANFVNLAAQYSDEKDANKTGGRYLADLTKQEPKFKEAIKDLKVGQVSKVISTKEGLVLFMLEAKNDGKFDSYQSRIAMNLMMMAEQERMAKLGQYVQGLTKKYTVKFFDNSYQPPQGIQAPGAAPGAPAK